MFNYQLTDVVAPRQVQDARIVLFPMRRNEHDHDWNQKDEHSLWADAVVRTTTEYGVHADGHEQGGPTVQPMVEKLSQRTACVRSARLLSVRTIYGKELEILHQLSRL